MPMALAAIQGLYQVVQEKDAEIAALDKRLVEQERTFATRLTALEKLVAKAATAPEDGIFVRRSVFSRSAAPVPPENGSPNPSLVTHEAE
jgi:hypothetical protein